MKIEFLIPIYIGVVGLLQGSLNKEMSLEIGAAHSVLIGMIISVILGVGFYFVVKLNPGYFSDFYIIKKGLDAWQWWYIFPGILGFTIVLLLPHGIHAMGAVKFTILLVAAQMIFSVCWDIWVEKMPISTFKWLGMFFAFVSVFIGSFK